MFSSLRRGRFCYCRIFLLFSCFTVGIFFAVCYAFARVGHRSFVWRTVFLRMDTDSGACSVRAVTDAWVERKSTSHRPCTRETQMCNKLSHHTSVGALSNLEILVNLALAKSLLNLQDTQLKSLNHVRNRKIEIPIL